MTRLAAEKDNFEKRLMALEALVEQMENGGMPLNETIKAYEKGIKLAEGLKAELTAADEKLTILRSGGKEE